MPVIALYPCAKGNILCCFDEVSNLQQILIRFSSCYIDWKYRIGGKTSNNESMGPWTYLFTKDKVATEKRMLSPKSNDGHYVGSISTVDLIQNVTKPFLLGVEIQRGTENACWKGPRRRDSKGEDLSTPKVDCLHRNWRKHFEMEISSLNRFLLVIV